MLEIRDLWFSYGDKPVLQGINLMLNDSVGCLLGPNGVGKTTLIKCIVGILKPQKGEILLDNINLLSLGYRDRAKLVSYVPQEFHINFPYTVHEVVLMGRNPYINPVKGPTGEDEERVDEVLELLGIKNMENRQFTSLSGGEKRLVLIARALAQDSKLVVLDEPTSFLDFKNRISILSIIRDVARKTGRLTLLTLHDPNLACLFCDKVYLLKAGRIIGSGVPDKIINEDNIEKIYGLEVKVIEIDNVRVIMPRYNLVQ